MRGIRELDRPIRVLHTSAWEGWLRTDMSGRELRHPGVTWAIRMSSGDGRSQVREGMGAKVLSREGISMVVLWSGWRHLSCHPIISSNCLKSPQ